MDFRRSVSTRKKWKTAGGKAKFFRPQCESSPRHPGIISTTALSTELRDKRAAGRS